jgi:hypothetical protein
MTNFDRIFITTLSSILIASIVAMAFCFLLLRKNANTYKNQILINKAICVYRMICIDRKENAVVDHDDAEDYDKTLWRLWDWGYTRILPKEKFEIVKPYIGNPSCFGIQTTPNGMAENGCYDCPFSETCGKIMK